MRGIMLAAAAAVGLAGQAEAATFTFSSYLELTYFTPDPTYYRDGALEEDEPWQKADPGNPIRYRAAFAVSVHHFGVYDTEDLAPYIPIVPTSSRNISFSAAWPNAKSYTLEPDYINIVGGGRAPVGTYIFAATYDVPSGAYLWGDISLNENGTVAAWEIVTGDSGDFQTMSSTRKWTKVGDDHFRYYDSTSAVFDSGFSTTPGIWFSQYNGRFCQPIYEDGTLSQDEIDAFGRKAAAFCAQTEIAPTVVPLPASAALLLTALGGAGLAARRRRA